MPIAKKEIIRVGDTIKIITPNIFVRVGYPLTVDIVRDTIITPEQRISIRSLVSSCLNTADDAGSSIRLDGTEDEERLCTKLLDDISYAVLRRKCFGGNIRSVYTELSPDLKDATCYVMGKRNVKSGTYVSGGFSYSYYGDDEYSPPYLKNEKTHVIQEVYADGCNEHINMGRKIEIEAMNVTRIKKGIASIRHEGPDTENVPCQ